MLEGPNNYVITIPVGVTLKIQVPIDLSMGYGFFPSQKTSIEVLNKTINLIEGFGVLNNDIGTLSNVSARSECPEILYTHLKQKTNKIFFFSDNDLYQTVSIINMPIHDHSNIQQGGPAFGTYFYDQSKAENETQG
jgi:hypothetical protein